MQDNYTMPIYQKIALDLANKIYTGNIAEGSTLYGRSVLAGKYNVSPETIRRAIKLLEDIKIVESVKGKGVIVLSSKKALSFIKKYQDITNISSYKSNLYKLLGEKSKLENEIVEGIIPYRKGAFLVPYDRPRTRLQNISCRKSRSRVL